MLYCSLVSLVWSRDLPESNLYGTIIVAQGIMVSCIIMIIIIIIDNNIPDYYY